MHTGIHVHGHACVLYMRVATTASAMNTQGCARWCHMRPTIRRAVSLKRLILAPAHDARVQLSSVVNLRAQCRICNEDGSGGTKEENVKKKRVGENPAKKGIIQTATGPLASNHWREAWQQGGCSLVFALEDISDALNFSVRWAVAVRIWRVPRLQSAQQMEQERRAEAAESKQKTRRMSGWDEAVSAWNIQRPARRWGWLVQKNTSTHVPLISTATIASTRGAGAHTPLCCEVFGGIP